MSNAILHTHYCRLMIEASKILFAIHDLRTEVSVCNENLLACIKDPLMVMEQAALRKQIEDYQLQMTAMRTEANQLRAEAKEMLPIKTP